MKIKIFILISFLSVLFLVTACAKDHQATDIHKESYTITFDTKGGSELTNMIVEEESRVIEPLEPQKEGFVFNGWYIDFECSVPFSFATIINRDLTLYANWDIKVLNVNVYSSETEKTTTTVNYGSNLQELAMPTKIGYTLEGLYYDQNYSASQKFDPLLEVVEDVNLYAKWVVNQYKLSIIIDEATTIETNVDYGYHLSGVAEPKKDGFMFDGFYKDALLTIPADMNSSVSKETTIYTKWIDLSKIKYTIVYLVDRVNSDEYEELLVEELTAPLGKTVSATPKVFTGLTCITDSASGEVTLDGSLRLELYYQRELYSLTYMINGTAYKTLAEVKYGTSLKLLSISEVKVQNYIFRGWYNEEELKDKATITKMPNEDVILYGKMEEIISGTEGLEFTLASSKTSYLVSGYNGNSEEVIIPNGYNSLPVTQVKSLASDVIKRITIMTNVTSINNKAFENCPNLIEIVLPETLTKIGEEAFLNCVLLTTVYIPKSVGTLPLSVFKGCSGLEAINIDTANKTFYSENGVLYEKATNTLLYYPVNKKDRQFTTASKTIILGVGCFNQNPHLENLIITDAVTTIMIDALRGCINLKKVEIGQGVTKISDSWLTLCEKIESITISPSNHYFTSVEGILFDKNLTTLIHYPSASLATFYQIPGTVKLVKYYAFASCQHLEQLVIPSSVKILEYKAVTNCPNLTIFIESETLLDSYHQSAFDGIKEIIFLPNWEYVDENPTKKEAI